MSDDFSIEEEIKKLKDQIDNYQKMSEHERIEKSLQLKRDIRICKKIVDKFLKQINNPEEYLQYSLESESDDMSENSESSNDTKFKEKLANINKIKSAFDDDKQNLKIDDKVALFLDLTKMVDWVEDYLVEQKSVKIEYLK